MISLLLSFLMGTSSMIRDDSTKSLPCFWPKRTKHKTNDQMAKWQPRFTLLLDRPSTTTRQIMFEP